VAAVVTIHRVVAVVVAEVAATAAVVVTAEGKLLRTGAGGKFHATGGEAGAKVPPFCLGGIDSAFVRQKGC
jgi:hypothetical protein